MLFHVTVCKNSWIKTKTIFSLSNHSFTLLVRMFEVFIIRSNKCCQMMTPTPMLYCTCMMVWSAVTSSINSR